MSLPKYFEDNLKISNERHLLASGEEFPFYEMPSNIGGRLILETLIVLEGVSVMQKTTKKKKKKIVCCDCGERFWFKGGEQKYFQKHKLADPKRCPACRGKRKEYLKSLKKSEEV